MTLPALVIGAQDVARGTTLTRWTATIERIVRGQKGCTQPRSTETVKVGGEIGSVLNYPDCPKSSGLYHLWIVVVHADRGYHIVWFNNAGHEEQDRRVLDTMLTSLSFTN